MTICQGLSAKIHHIGLFEGQITSPLKVQKDATVNNKANEKFKNSTSNSDSNKISKVKIAKEGPS